MKTVSAFKRKEVRRAFPNKEKVFDTPLGELRRRWGFSYREISEHTGIDKSTLCRAEAGLTIKLETAIKLAKFYEKPVEEIWKPAARPNGKAKR